MKKLLAFLLFALPSILFGQAKTDSYLKTESTNEILGKTYLPSRANTMNQDIIDSKKNYIDVWDATGTDSYTVSITPVSSFVNNQSFKITFPNANTTAVTINSIPVKKNVSVALVAGDICAGCTYDIVYKSSPNVFQITLASAVAPGSDKQMVRNKAGLLYADSKQVYDDALNNLTIGTGITSTGAGTRTDNFYLGLNHTDVISGNSSSSSRWNMLMGEQFTLSDSSTAATTFNDDFLLGGFFNRLMISPSGGNIAVSGILGGTSNMINSRNGPIAFGSIILGGYANVITPASSAVARFRGNFILGGSNNASTEDGSGAMGYWSQSSGKHSLVHGYATTFVGGSSGNLSFPNPNLGTNHTGTVPRILASGKHAINMSANSPHQTSGNGALGDYSGIFAGVNGHVTGKNSASIGGYELTTTDTGTVVVPYLKMQYKPLRNDTIHNVLVWDYATGKAKIRYDNTFSGGGSSPLSGNGTTVSNDSVHIGGDIIKDIILDSDTDGINSITIGETKSPHTFSTFTGDASNGYISFSNSEGTSGWNYYDVDRVSQLASFKMNWLSPSTGVINYYDVLGNFILGGRGFIYNGSDGTGNTYSINIDETSSSISNFSSTGENSGVSFHGSSIVLESNSPADGTCDIKINPLGINLGNQSFTNAAVAHIKAMSANTVIFRVDNNSGTKAFTVDQVAGANRLSFFNTTPTIQATNTANINTLLQNYGLIASGATSSNFSIPVKTTHLIGGTSAPTIAAGTGAGTSPTVSISNGTDMSGIVNITTGTVPTAGGIAATITFNTAYGQAPNISLTPGNSATALLSGVTMVFVTSTTTTFVITSGTTALTASTAYKWFYTVMQ